MDLEIEYQGRVVTADGIAFINRLIAENPAESRRALSKRLCKAWNWVQPNGTLKDMFCRSFMLYLDRNGFIKLPAKKFSPYNPLATRKDPAKANVDQTPINTTLSEIKSFKIQQVRWTRSEKLFNSLIAHHHYLSYCHPIGEHLKYIVFIEERSVACLSWSSAVRHIGCRDKYIGWTKTTREKNLSGVIYNNRFLILPWVRVANLATYILGQMIKVLPRDWERIYNHPIYFLESFVDKDRYKGTCYRASNWVYLGETTGRGKNDQTNKPNRSIKTVWGYPLVKNFREVLQS